MTDEVARNKGARYRLDKTPQHTLLIRKIALSYPDARFVALVRDAREVLRPNSGGGGWAKKPGAGRASSVR